MKNRAAAELSGFPFTVPSDESSAPFVPIVISSLLPSCEYFWTIPDGELAIHTLLSASKKQLWSRGSSSLGSPHELISEPSASISMIGGASLPAFRSPSSTSCRLRRNTWSRASTHTPANPPNTHRSGNGLGHDVSTS